MENLGAAHDRITTAKKNAGTQHILKSRGHLLSLSLRFPALFLAVER
jgi:hypothetical protein